MREANVLGRGTLPRYVATGQGVPGSADSNVPFPKSDRGEATRDAAHERPHGLRGDAIVTLPTDAGYRRGGVVIADRGMIALDDGVLWRPGDASDPTPATARTRGRRTGGGSNGVGQQRRHDRQGSTERRRAGFDEG